MRFIVTLIVAVCMTLGAVAQERAEWRFSTKRTAAFKTNNKYPSLVGKGQLTFVGKKATRGIGLKKYHPAVLDTRVGDYWLFTMPVENVQAGTAVDVMIPFLAAPSVMPIGFALEYLDGGKWKPAAQTINKAGSTHITPPSDETPRFIWQTMRFEHPVQDGLIQVRLRQCEKGVTKWSLYGSANGDAPRMTRYDARIPQDTTRLLFLGNSYTFYHMYPTVLKDMAWQEGHYLDCAISVHGGYSIQQHTNDATTLETIEQGGYKYIFLQDQSSNAVRIGTTVDKGTVSSMQKMIEIIKQADPTAQPVIAHLWARKIEDGTPLRPSMQEVFEVNPEYFANYETLQRVTDTKTLKMAEDLGVPTTPIGFAWSIVRRERPAIELYRPDSYHPSANGAYLQAAVVYLWIFKTPFGDAAFNGELDAETAAYLRSVAERVVLKGERP